LIGEERIAPVRFCAGLLAAVHRLERGGRGSPFRLARGRALDHLRAIIDDEA